MLTPSYLSVSTMTPTLVIHDQNCLESDNDRSKKYTTLNLHAYRQGAYVRGFCILKHWVGCFDSLCEDQQERMVVRFDNFGDS